MPVVEILGLKNLHDLSIDELKVIEERQKLEEISRKVTEVLYYTKYPDGSQITTILIITPAGEVVAKGLSVMSSQDNPRKIEGRVRARGRALRAVKSGRNSAEIKIREDNALNTALQIACAYGDFKSVARPELTEYEEQLVFSATHKE
jgi:hypothetical protein